MFGESTRSTVAAIGLAVVLVFAAVFIGGPLPARGAAPVTLPDLVIRVPTDLISVGTNSSTGDRQLEFTHVTADIGAGPFEIDPRYESNTQTATFKQEIYNSPSPGVWNPDHSVPVAASGVWVPSSDYAFPLTRFTLNRVNADGSVGLVAATSPKTDFCITGDTMVSGVPDTPDQTFIPQSNCSDPTAPLGWSVGWGDQYDQTDSGQPIDLTGVPNGTYILQAIVDPRHVLTESNTKNDVTDTKLQITGMRATVLSQWNPATTQTGTSSGSGHGKSTLKVRVLRWRHGVLTLAVGNLPNHARLSVELKFAHGRPRFVNAPGGRLRLRTAVPRAIVLRVFLGTRRMGGTITLGLGESPRVRVINPIADETLSGTVPIVADATDNAGISSLRFEIDGRPIGRPVTRSPYVIRWRTTGARPGRHRISVVATDAAGNGASAATVVTVQNPRPPMTCFVLQAHLSAEGHGIATTPALHTAMPKEMLLAFVSADGPVGPRRQAATVSGAGGPWKLIERANAGSGDSEVWATTAQTILTTGQITATLSNPSFDESLTVIAIEGVKGIGTTVRASGITGAPHLELTTSDATSLVFAVGNDWDRAVPRVLPSGWVPLDQRLDSHTGDTFWTQYTNWPTVRAGSVVAVRTAAPTTDQWNLAAVELVNSGD